jgi:transmembrane sensor
VLAQLTPVDVQQAVAWQQRKIAFEQRPLGEVADEFNRYGSIPIEIDDAALRALPISGVFDAHDIDSFVAFLQTIDRVLVTRSFCE